VRVSFALAAALLLMLIGPPLVVLRVLHADRATLALIDSDNEASESTAVELAAPVRPTDVHVDDLGATEMADAPRLDDHANGDHQQRKVDRKVDEAASPHDVVASESIASIVGWDVEAAEPDVGVTKADGAPIVAAARAASTQLGNAAFTRGRVALASHQTDRAITAFAEAAEADPDVALYHYHWALALHMDGQPAVAADRVYEAARLEREHGLANWGQVMSQVQGRARLWLERARRQALGTE
jgi:hypothetical protein